MSVLPAKRVKAGSNWKKLQRTLTSEEGESSSRPKKHSRLSSSGVSLHHDHKSTTSRDHAPISPAVPWFAEDLSPEDLALLHTSRGRSTDTDNGKEAPSDMNAVLAARKKKQDILGGQDMSKEKQEPGTHIAIDCEMVGVGLDGGESMLARVSIVNWNGAVLMDTFVKPREKVTDYRTWVSGVRPKDLQNAPSFQEVQSQVADLIKGRVLVGHAINNDLKALLLSHPRPLIRDTAQNKLCRELAKTKHPSLRKLVELRLGIEIQKQGSEHSSVEDARATMALYRTLHADWQKTMSTGIIGKGWKKTDKSRKGSSGSISSKDHSDPNWWKAV